MMITAKNENLKENIEREFKGKVNGITNFEIKALSVNSNGLLVALLRYTFNEKTKNSIWDANLILAEYRTDEFIRTFTFDTLIPEFDKAEYFWDDWKGFSELKNNFTLTGKNNIVILKSITEDQYEQVMGNLNVQAD